ncbi:uncharacterized protein PG986_002608 [Apiospora aurea]|uniref:BTB domain-containing protein n=1 Tax=Apiospora aurea TaxID=335848 RepID=A0ABR1QPS8_9PEZI
MEETEILHEIDPNGDVELILRNPNAPFAVWDENTPALKSFNKSAASDETKRKYDTAFGGGQSFFDSVDPGKPTQPLPRCPSAQSTATDVPAQPCQGEPAVDKKDEQERTVRFRLSSKHLEMASTFFKDILTHRDPEEEGNVITIETTSWDTDAMLVLMNIIHGRHRNVPRRLDLEKIAQIAVIVDYFRYHEVVDAFEYTWINEQRRYMPTMYCRDLVLWLAISYNSIAPSYSWL